MDGAKRRGKLFGYIDVVETNHRNIIWNSQA